MDKYEEQELKKKKLIKNCITIGVIVVAVLIIVTNCIGTVPVNHTGVWKRLGVVQPHAVSEGMHLKIPFVDSIESISNQVQMAKIWSSQTDKSATTKETAETKDQQLIMEYTFEVQYQLDKTKSFIVYQNYGKNYEKLLVVDNSLPIIKQAFAQYESEQIVPNKENIALYVQEKLSEFTEQFGIHILRVNFISYDFTAEYDKILEERASLKAKKINEQIRQEQEKVTAQTNYDVAVKKAEQDAETARIAAENQKEVALVEAEKNKSTRIIEANAKAEADKIAADNQAYVQITIANAERDARLAAAEATKAELEAQASGLNELIIQRSFIEKWDGKLIPSFGGTTSFNVSNLTDIYKHFLGFDN